MQKNNGGGACGRRAICASAAEAPGRGACIQKAVLDRGLKGRYAGFRWIAEAARRKKASAKIAG